MDEPTAIRNDTTRVAVFGETLVDVFPDRTVVGGAPLNVAVHLERLGLSPVVFSRIGDDENGRKVRETMRAAGLDTRGLQLDPTLPTGSVAVIHTETGHRFDILAGQAYDAIDADEVVAVVRESAFRLVYFGTLAQRESTSRAALAALLAETDGSRWLDVNLRAPWYFAETLERSLEAATAVKVNNEELRVVADLVGLDASGDEERVASSIVERFGLESAIVTCGERGAWTIDASGTVTRVESRPLDGPLADTVGAGDAFAAVCIVGLVRGWPVAATLARADSLARAICGIRGAIPPDPSFYDPIVAGWSA